MFYTKLIVSILIIFAIILPAFNTKEFVSDKFNSVTSYPSGEIYRVIFIAENQHILNHFNGLGDKIYKNMGVFFGQAFAQDSEMGFQSTVQTPRRELTACSANFIFPSSICIGTKMNDIIIGPLAGGTVFGNDGDDRIRGILSQQIIFGNEGDDSIHGGNNTNVVFGNNGDDTLVGGSGFDPIKGGGGSLLTGNSGNDKLIGGPDHDVLEGGRGFDLFRCNGKTDLVLDFDPRVDKATGNCIFK